MADSDDLQFERALEDYNKDFVESEIFDTWKPPDGEYIVVPTKCSGRLIKDQESGKMVPLLGLVATIGQSADETLKGREFDLGPYSAKAFGILKLAAEVLKGGSADKREKVASFREARDILQASVGAVLRVRAESRYSEKRKQDFTSITILEVVSRAGETATPSEAPPDAPPEAPPEVPATEG